MRAAVLAATVLFVACATAPPPPPLPTPVAAADIVIPAPRPKRDLTRALHLQAAPGVLSQAQSVRVTVSLENEAGIIQTQEQSVDLSVGDADLQSVVLNVKIEPA